MRNTKSRKAAMQGFWFVISFHLLKVLILIHHAHGSQTLPNHSTARVVIIDKISNIMGSIGEIIIGYMFYDGLLLIKIIKYFVEHRNTCSFI